MCCEVQAAVGCSVTAKCSTWRRRWSSTKNTNSTFMVIVGTVKKSSRLSDPDGCAGTSSSSDWEVGERRAEPATRCARRSGYRASVIQHGCVAPAKVDWPPPSARSSVGGRRQSLADPADGDVISRVVPRIAGSARAASGRQCRAERISMRRPVGPQTSKRGPEYSVESRQDRSLAAPSKGGELSTQGGIFQCDGLITAKQQSEEPKDGQNELGHLNRSPLHPIHNQPVGPRRSIGERQLTFPTHPSLTVPPFGPVPALPGKGKNALSVTMVSRQRRLNNVAGDGACTGPPDLSLGCQLLVVSWIIRFCAPQDTARGALPDVNKP